MTNLASTLKSKDITLPTKIYVVKSMVFPVVMYGCESGNIKEAKHQRVDAFKLFWRRLFRVQLSHQYMTTEKTIALTGQTFVGKVMSLFFNMLSKLGITFLQRSK